MGLKMSFLRGKVSVFGGTGDEGNLFYFQQKIDTYKPKLNNKLSFFLAPKNNSQKTNNVQF